MLSELTQLIIALAFEGDTKKLQNELDNLTYTELITLYAMCLTLSKYIRKAPNFGNPPYKKEE